MNQLKVLDDKSYRGLSLTLYINQKVGNEKKNFAYENFQNKIHDQIANQYKV